MTPTAIALTAWEARDTRPPLDTIFEALELDAHPRLHTHGTDAVNRYSACLDAWRDLVQERTGGDYALALPKRSPDGRKRKIRRVEHTCPICGTVRGVLPSDLHRVATCGATECVGEWQSRLQAGRLTDRNNDIFGRWMKGVDPDVLAEEHGLSRNRVLTICREVGGLPEGRAA